MNNAATTSDGINLYCKNKSDSIPQVNELIISIISLSLPKKNIKDILIDKKNKIIK